MSYTILGSSSTPGTLTIPGKSINVMSEQYLL